MPLCPPSGAVVESPATQIVGTVALEAAPLCLSVRLCGSAEAATPKLRRYGSDDWSFMMIASAKPLLYFTNELVQEQVDLSGQRSTKHCAKCPVLILMLMAPQAVYDLQRHRKMSSPKCAAIGSETPSLD